MSPRALLALILSSCFFAASAEAQRPVPLQGFGRNNNVSQLVEGRDGALYGNTFGRIFRLTTGGAYRELYNFGSMESPEIVAAEDGHLYGAYRFGERPSLFRLSYTGRMELLATLPAQVGDQFFTAGGLTIGPDGALYGFTTAFNGETTLFRATLDGEITSVADFTATKYRWFRRPIVGHDGALRVIARAKPDNSPYYSDLILRVTLDGVITEAYPFNGYLGDITAVAAHPDGGYAVSIYSGIRRLLADGTLSGFTEISGMHWWGPVAARDGFLYAGRNADPAGGGELLRIHPTDGTLLSMADRMRGRLEQPRLLVQNYQGDLFGAARGRGYSETIFRWRAPGQTTVNLGPYAQPDFARPPAPGKSVTLRVLANDRDVNGDPISITQVGSPRLGSAVLSADGRSIIYTAPEAGAAADDFTYTIEDGQGGRGMGRVALREDLRGTFTGLLANASAAEDGHLQVRLGRYGALTGELWLGGFRWRFAGALDGAQRFQAQLAGARTVDVTLQVRGNGAGISIDATVVSNGVTLKHTLTQANRQKAAQAAGLYTFLIPTQLSWRDLPRSYSEDFGYVIDHPLQSAQGHGYGTWRVMSTGAVVTRGRMPDGEPFAATNWLDAQGRLAFFATLYEVHNVAPEPMRGWVRGYVALTNNGGNAEAATGSLRWAFLYPGTSNTPQVITQVSLSASRYTPPKNLEQDFGAVLGIQADGGRLAAPLAGTAAVAWNALQGAPGLRINGKLNPANGLVSGHLGRANSGMWKAWSGVWLQSRGKIFGQFEEFDRYYYWGFPLGTGRMEITPK